MTKVRTIKEKHEAFFCYENKNNLNIFIFHKMRQLPYYKI